MRALARWLVFCFGLGAWAGCDSAQDKPATGRDGADSARPEATDSAPGDSEDRGTDSGDPLDPATVEPAGSWCATPIEALTYTDVAAAWGLIDTTDGVESRKEAGPVASVDLDGDGLDELIVGHRTQGLVLHRNRGGSFEQQVLIDAEDLTGIALGDVDGDGDLDLWTGGYVDRMWLLRNDGAGSDGWIFTDITEQSGLAALEVVPQRVDASFGDFDADGDLDVYLTRDGPAGTAEEPALDQLLRSAGDGTFEVVSDWLSVEQRQGKGWAALWSDLDLDLDPDLFVANADQSTDGPSLMVRNDGANGDAWRLTDRGDHCACTSNYNPMGVSAGDFDNDGDFDLFLTNTNSDQLLRNEGALSFVDVSRAIGNLALPSDRHMTFGAVWTDVDNDGWQDLFLSAGPLSQRPNTELDRQRDRLLLNQAGAALEDHADRLGVDSRGIGRGVTRALLDDDGYPELVVVNLDGPSHIWHTPCLAHRALVVELRQSSGNTRGIGARVTVSFADGTIQRQEVSSKPGWGGAMEPRAWFGLGDREPRAIRVAWPDGVETALSLPADTDGRLRIER
ncbi:MAG TPA: hypothetical protein DFR83_25140 [Deltaproteobacteria bacterium]|nr:hypothetical protein [Deltaproteobacteria bacterium]